jgi:hypothetical protein
MHHTLKLLHLCLRAAEVAARKALELPAAVRNPNLDEHLPHVPYILNQLREDLEFALRGDYPDAAAQDAFVDRLETLVSKMPRKG